MRTIEQIKNEMKKVKKKKYNASNQQEAEQYEYELRTLQIELEQALSQ